MERGAVLWVILIVLVLVVILCLIYGRRRDGYEFVGLAPLIPGERSLRYWNDNSNPNVDDTVARVAANALGTEENGEEGSVGTFSTEPRVQNFDAESHIHESRHLPDENPARVPDASEETNEASISLETPLPYKGNGQSSRKEEICRKVLEEIYGLPFPKVRPDFLKNPETGRNLELDGYCHQLRLGFEFNGAQHYVYPNNFHKSTEEFLHQVHRDNFKYKFCKRQGIHLIVVPQDIPASQIRDFIMSQLPQKGRGVTYVNSKRH